MMCAAAGPGEPVAQAAIAAASVAASPAATLAALMPPGTLDVADGEDRVAAGGRAAARLQRFERFGGRAGDPVGFAEEERRPDRCGHQHRGGDRPGPVFFADQGDGDRPLLPARCRGRRQARRRRR